jgi:hypothetical protein
VVQVVQVAQAAQVVQALPGKVHGPVPAIVAEGIPEKEVLPAKAVTVAPVVQAEQENQVQVMQLHSSAVVQHQLSVFPVV